MLIVCWSAKGGVGTTVVAASLALLCAGSTPTVAIDLAGDLPATLGCADPPGPGVAEWLTATSSTADGLLRLATPVVGALQLVHAGAGGWCAARGWSGDRPSAGVVPSARDEPSAGAGASAGARWERIADACAAAARRGDVVVDAGRNPPPALTECADRSVIVVRQCYLSLRRSTLTSSRADAAVLVTEPGRALHAADVEHALGVPVLAQVPWDPAVARAVDAGSLAAQLPRSLQRPLRRLRFDVVHA